MLDKEEIKRAKEIFEAEVKEDIAKYDCVNDYAQYKIDNHRILLEYIEQLETDNKKLTKLAKQKDFLYNKALSELVKIEKEKEKLIKKLKERIKEITSNSQYDFVGSEWKESWVVEELQEILKIMKGEKE